MKDTRIMKWYCISCGFKFDGPSNRPSKNGCTKCGSQRTIDLNVFPISAGELVLVNAVLNTYDLPIINQDVVDRMFSDKKDGKTSYACDDEWNVAPIKSTAKG